MISAVEVVSFCTRDEALGKLYSLEEKAAGRETVRPPGVEDSMQGLDTQEIVSRLEKAIVQSSRGQQMEATCIAPDGDLAEFDALYSYAAVDSYDEGRGFRIVISYSITNH